MRRLTFLLAAIGSGWTSAALAGPMPALPELPALPAKYEFVRDGGFYAGVLGGYSFSAFEGPTLGAVFGHSFHTSGIILGAESFVLVSKGSASIDGGIRIGVPLGDKFSTHASVGLGYSALTDAYTAVGLGAELTLSADLSARFDYRYQHDLTFDAPAHVVVTGLVRPF